MNNSTNPTVTVGDIKRWINEYNLSDDVQIQINSVYDDSIEEYTPTFCSGFYHEKDNKIYLTSDEIDIVDHCSWNCESMDYRLTNRGFKIAEFEDSGGKECSIQESSSVEPRIWLGLNHVEPLLFLPDIDKSQTGWITYPLPKEVHLFGRMELNQEMVKNLLPSLIYFVENGCLPENNIDEVKGERE